MAVRAKVRGTDVHVQRRGLARMLGWAAFATFSGSLATLVTLMIFTAGSPGTVAMVIGMMLLGVMVVSPTCALVAMIVGLARWHLARRRASLVIDDDRLLVITKNHETVYPLSSFRTGWLNPRKREIELEMVGGDVVRARVASVEGGRRLLETAGLLASRRAAAMRLGATLPLDVLVMGFGPIALWPPISSLAQAAPWPWPLNVWVYLAAFLVLFHSARQMFGPAQLVIGSDGVIVRQNFQHAFVPWERIAQMDVGPSAVTLSLTDGSMLKARARALGADQQEQLRSRLADAHAAWSACSRDAGATVGLERRGRSVAAWRAAISTLLEREDGYREKATTPDQLLATMESAAAPAERRIGAAIALVATGDADVRTRVRIAAEASANGRLRVALESVAGGIDDDELIEEALEGNTGETAPARLAAVDEYRS